MRQFAPGASDRPAGRQRLSSCEGFRVLRVAVEALTKPATAIAGGARAYAVTRGRNVVGGSRRLLLMEEATWSCV
jgi:hypothetical protein